jgi:group I intron endonuclease
MLYLCIAIQLKRDKKSPIPRTAIRPIMVNWIAFVWFGSIFMGCIYKITNLVNGKIYVGKTKHSSEHRFRIHVSDSKRESKTTIQKALRKYGEHSFKVETLIELDEPYLNEAEIFFIKLLNARDSAVGYNITSGGDGFGSGPQHPCWGIKKPPEESERIRKLHTGRKLSDETKKRIGDGHRGEKSVNYGKHLPEEQRNNIKKALTEFYKKNKSHMIGKIPSRETVNKRIAKNNKAVLQYDLTGNFIREYGSIKETSKYGYAKLIVSLCCRGKQAQYRGFIWKFKNNES